MAYPGNILVEYLQHELLDSIYKQKESAQLSFIGDTAIRIVYNGNRFSEDLGFKALSKEVEPFLIFSDQASRVR